MTTSASAASVAACIHRLIASNHFGARVYRDVVPEDVTSPYVVIEVSSDAEVVTRAQQMVNVVLSVTVASPEFTAATHGSQLARNALIDKGTQDTFDDPLDATSHGWVIRVTYMQSRRSQIVMTTAGAVYVEAFLMMVKMQGV